MADEDRSFAPSSVQTNRAEHQGLGVGQRELNAQRGADRNTFATDPERTEPFDETLDPTTNADRPSQADFSGQDVGRPEMRPRAEQPGAGLDDRNAAGLDEGGGDLGAATPSNVDVHDLGQEDAPEQDWGEEMGEEATFSANHTRRPDRTEAERGQGAKTRRLNKDIISRRT
jgi:hypothetical protein